jgi:hypothetical protein
MVREQVTSVCRTGEIPLPRTIAITRIAKSPFSEENASGRHLRRRPTTEVTIRSPLRNEAIVRRSFQCLSGESKPPVKLGKPVALKAGRTKASSF